MAVFAFMGLLFHFYSENVLARLFESFYRYGYLVIGGGQVVIPMLYSEQVEANRDIDNFLFSM